MRLTLNNIIRFPFIITLGYRILWKLGIGNDFEPPTLRALMRSNDGSSAKCAGVVSDAASRYTFPLGMIRPYPAFMSASG